MRAYRLSLQGQPSPVIDGLNGEQRLFVRWAQIWRSKTREAYLPQTLFLDQHAPPEYRAHGAVVNLTRFTRLSTSSPAISSIATRKNGCESGKF